MRVATTSHSKWKGSMLKVSKVETASSGSKILQLTTNEGLVWVSEENFKQIFESFLVVGARKSHFWTTQRVRTSGERRAVVKRGRETN